MSTIHRLINPAALTRRPLDPAVAACAEYVPHIADDPDMHWQAIAATQDRIRRRRAETAIDLEDAQQGIAPRRTRSEVIRSGYRMAWWWGWVTGVVTGALVCAATIVAAAFFDDGGHVVAKKQRPALVLIQGGPPILA